MKTILARTGEKIMVSNQDYPFLSNFSWYLDRKGYPYARVVISKLIILGRSGLVRDHRNGNRLDNRRQNLRLVTNSQNLQNQKPQEGRSSKYKGVSLRLDSKKWKAYINIRRAGVKKQISLGCFSIEKDAALAYDCAARRLFKQYARTNF